MPVDEEPLPVPQFAASSSGPSYQTSVFFHGPYDGIASRIALNRDASGKSCTDESGRGTNVTSMLSNPSHAGNAARSKRGVRVGSCPRHHASTDSASVAIADTAAAKESA